MINTLFKREYYVIIHYGEIPPQRTFKVYNTFFNKAKRVIAVSGDIKKNYDNRFDINCEVLFPLVPFEKCNTEKSVLRNKYGISEDSFLITMVGSVKDMKNPDTLLEALSLFTKRERELYKLHIAYAGTGNMQGLLKEKTQQLGLGEIVHFLGFIPKEDVNEIFKMSDAYTIASDFEGTSVSLLEAMYNKLPIFASHAPGIKDMIIENHSALMFKTRNAEELKKQILSVLSNPQLAKSLSYNAYKDFIQKYDYNRIIDRYVEIFNE